MSKAILGGDFWTVVSGIAFLLAGTAILSGILDVLASRLLALMLLIFSALVLAPHVFTQPRDHVAWDGNAYNLAAVGAAWIFASIIASRRAELVRDCRLPLAETSRGLSQDHRFDVLTTMMREQGKQ